MKIQAISPMMSAINCQPIRPVKFGRKSVPQEFLINQTLSEDEDSLLTQEILKRKYYTACDIAAFYKTEYEKLLREGNCLA